MTGFAKYLTCAAAAGLMATASTASAQEAVFVYHNKELRSEAGSVAVLNRLRMAARSECRSQLLVLTKAEKQCRREVEEQWISRIDSTRFSWLAASANRQIALGN